MSSLTDPIGSDLTATLRALKLGKLTATLPERLTLARQHNMPHADFLQLILSDEVARREAGSIALRAKNAGLDRIAPGFVEAPNPRESGTMGAARKYPDELRDRAVRLVLDLVKDQEASVTAACRKVGGELGIKADTLRGWAKQAQVDRGLRPGTALADAARIRALERENAELRRVNAILRTASAFFAAELGHR